MKKSLLYLDLNLYANVNIINYNSKSIDENLLKVTDIVELRVSSLKNRAWDNTHRVSMIVPNKFTAEALRRLINIALYNMKSYKINKRNDIISRYQKKRDNRKFYQFWLNKSNKKINEIIDYEYGFWGKHYQVSEYYYSLYNKLESIEKELEFYSLCCNNTLEISMTNRLFGQFLHFLSKESHMINH